MRLTIRYKLLMYMLMSVVLFAGLLFFANTYLIEKYYLEIKKADLLKNGKEVIEIVENLHFDEENNKYTLDYKNFEEILRIERLSGQSVYVDSNDDNIYPRMKVVMSFGVDNIGLENENVEFEVEVGDNSPVAGTTVVESRVDKLPAMIKDGSEGSIESRQDVFKVGFFNYDTENQGLREPKIKTYNSHMFYGAMPIHEFYDNKNVEIISGDTSSSYFAYVQDEILKVNTLRYQRTLDNGITVSISMPVSAISEGVAISNKFSSIVGIITIFFTIIWALYISNRFTKPIKQMNNVANKMSSLDFTEIITVTGEDELGWLAFSINDLSAKLDSTIKELNTKNEKLSEDIDKERRIDKMRRDFISNVSHELKTPIFLIQGYADGLKHNIIGKEEKKNFYCDVIIEESDKMNVLIKDLLTLAKVESGMTDTVKADVNIQDFIISIVDKYKIRFEERGIKYSISRLEKDKVVKCDPFKMEQVVTNLINNAIEYAKNEKEIKIRLTNEYGKIRVGIYNTGINISDDDKNAVWNSFYKVDESRNREIGGAGLGLSIVKAILDEHGAEYGIKNSENGVEFYFSFEF